MQNGGVWLTMCTVLQIPFGTFSEIPLSSVHTVSLWLLHVMWMRCLWLPGGRGEERSRRGRTVVKIITTHLTVWLFQLLDSGHVGKELLFYWSHGTGQTGQGKHWRDNLLGGSGFGYHWRCWHLTIRRGSLGWWDWCGYIEIENRKLFKSYKFKHHCNSHSHKFLFSWIWGFLYHRVIFSNIKWNCGTSTTSTLLLNLKGED